MHKDCNRPCNDTTAGSVVSILQVALLVVTVVIPASDGTTAPPCAGWSQGKSQQELLSPSNLLGRRGSAS